jgi:hypothetical protein
MLAKGNAIAGGSFTPWNSGSAMGMVWLKADFSLD